MAETWQECVEAIEAGYEYMLAYAAQGLEASQSGAHEAEVRKHLQAMSDALLQVAALGRELAQAHDGADTSHYASYLNALEHDANHALGAVQLVATRKGISSQLIDNLNASSHLRALLTDLFLLDEAMHRGG